jgi:hypothetical protein
LAGKSARLPVACHCRRYQRRSDAQRDDQPSHGSVPFRSIPRSRGTSKHSRALVDWLRVTENLAASIAAVVGQEARPLIHLGPTGHEKSRRLCRQSERSIQRTALPFLGMRDRIRLLPSATSGRGRHRQGECLPDGPTPSTAPMCDHEAALAV